MRQLTVRHLGKEHLGKAFTLIQASAPCISYDSWRRHAHKLTGDRENNDRAVLGGLLGAEDQRGILAGLASYQVHSTIETTGVLQVTDFIAFDLFRREEIAQALIRALESEAHRHTCQAVHFMLSGGLSSDTPSWLETFLTDQGLMLNGPIYCKALPQDA